MKYVMSIFVFKLDWASRLCEKDGNICYNVTDMPALPTQTVDTILIKLYDYLRCEVCAITQKHTDIASISTVLFF
jgi:ubiquitin-protein ligase